MMQILFLEVQQSTITLSEIFYLFRYERLTNRYSWRKGGYDWRGV